MSATTPLDAEPRHGAPEYVPLDWRTIAASTALAVHMLFSIAYDLLQATSGKQVEGDTPELVTALAVFGAAIGNLFTAIVAAVLYCVWIHRAAKNLGALGRYGTTFTPGWCVGWFFVPFFNLVRPLQAVKEIWRASDPAAREDGWHAQPGTPWLGVWWGTWLVGNIIATRSARIEEASMEGRVGLVGDVFSLVAAGACIYIMREISQRQQQIALRAREG